MTYTTEQLEKLLAAATPGPLRVEQDTTLIWGACNPDDNSSRGMGYPIAECRITAMSSWAKGPDADAGEANARGMAMWRDIAADLIRLRSEVATLRASDVRMREAVTDLEKAATEVARYGAQTGPQWSRLTVANLRARAALQGETK